MSSRSFALLTIAAVSIFGPGCGNPRADDDRSATTLTAVLKASEGANLAGTYVDVVSDDGSVSDEILTMTLTSVPKDPLAELSPFYAITVQGVTISYSRLNSRNVPGVDVPFPISYALSANVPQGGTSDTEFIAVTEEAKLQAPLRNLWFGEGQRIFATMTVTVFGVDQVGNQVQATTSTVLIFTDTAG